MWASLLSFRREVLHLLNSTTGISSESYLTAEAKNCERQRCVFESWFSLWLTFSITLTRTVIIVESFFLLPIQAEEQRVQKLCGTWRGTDQILRCILLPQGNAFQQEKHNWLLFAKRKWTARPSWVIAKNFMSLSWHCQKKAWTDQYQI